MPAAVCDSFLPGGPLQPANMLAATESSECAVLLVSAEEASHLPQVALAPFSVQTSPGAAPPAHKHAFGGDALPGGVLPSLLMLNNANFHQVANVTVQAPPDVPMALVRLTQKSESSAHLPAWLLIRARAPRVLQRVPRMHLRVLCSVLSNNVIFPLMMQRPFLLPPPHQRRLRGRQPTRDCSLPPWTLGRLLPPSSNGRVHPIRMWSLALVRPNCPIHVIHMFLHHPNTKGRPRGRKTSVCGAHTK